MRNLLNFSLFESSGFDYVGLKTDRDYRTHIDFALNGLARYNKEKDFPRWCMFEAYSRIILEDGISQENTDYILKKSNEYYPEGFKTDFDFNKEIERSSSLGVKSTNWFLKTFLMEEMRGIKAKGAQTAEAKKAFINAVEKSASVTLSDLFLPGNLANIQKLKYLDYIYEYTEDENYLATFRLDFTISQYITNGFNNFISLYPAGNDRDNKAGDKLISLMKIFANHNMVYFKNLKLPDSMAEYIVKYFNINKDSYKTADELRKANVGIYNRIKEILPDVDTAADLGDLGF